jgi:hypothetical protein
MASGTGLPKRSSSRKLGIIGGIDATLGQFPHVVDLSFRGPNFSLLKKFKFSEFSQCLQLDGASSVCPANFFRKAYLITFQTSIFSSKSGKGFTQSKQRSTVRILKMRFLQVAKKK